MVRFLGLTSRYIFFNKIDKNDLIRFLLGTKARDSNSKFLKEQFENWSQEIHACLDNTPDEIIEQRDLYDRRPSVLKSWSKGHVTMLGDAVHPVS
jgi:zeaxanthin epoxidase